MCFFARYFSSDCTLLIYRTCHPAVSLWGEECTDITYPKYFCMEETNGMSIISDKTNIDRGQGSSDSLMRLSLILLFSWTFLGLLAVHFQPVCAMFTQAVELSPRGLLDLIFSLMEQLKNSFSKNVLRLLFEACKHSEWYFKIQFLFCESTVSPLQRSVAVNCRNRADHLNTTCGQNAEILSYIGRYDVCSFHTGHFLTFSILTNKMH